MKLAEESKKINNYGDEREMKSKIKNLAKGLMALTLIATMTPIAHTTVHATPTQQEARAVFSTGTVGPNGAPWVLYNDGVVEVESGFINWTNGARSPWDAHRNNIHKIVFNGPITAGESLSGLFTNLQNVTEIEGLHYFDTSMVQNMNHMFINTRSLVELDLSNWDTSNVLHMERMFFETGLSSLNLSNWDTSNVRGSMSWLFANARNLEVLNISNWDIGNTTNLLSMLQQATSLRQLTLGENFTSTIPSFTRIALPEIVANEVYTGRWQNVGAGTLNNPQGEFVFTSTQLIAHYATNP
ncbi:MAG: BspA family leucine-rich repeat surface protein, partial [Defluviitaleaceae bacterium]|nr:BspA family leucine-rich repeat surface protein [Defluviitaleaceae bacterium]